MKKGEVFLSMAMLKRIIEDIHTNYAATILPYKDDEIILKIKQDKNSITITGTINKEAENIG